MGPCVNPLPFDLVHFCQPSNGRFTPMGGTPLYKKQLGVFLHIFNILRKK
jgi:hypothetical protein